MNKQKYLAELAGLLSFLSEDDRSTVISHYAEKFDEAGESGESALINDLDTPMRLAITLNREGIESIKEAEKNAPELCEAAEETKASEEPEIAEEAEAVEAAVEAAESEAAPETQEKDATETSPAPEEPSAEVAPEPAPEGEALPIEESEETLPDRPDEPVAVGEIIAEETQPDDSEPADDAEPAKPEPEEAQAPEQPEAQPQAEPEDAEEPMTVEEIIAAEVVIDDSELVDPDTQAALEEKPEPEITDISELIRAVKDDEPHIHNEAFPELTVARGKEAPEAKEKAQTKLSVLGAILFWILMIVPGVPLIVLSGLAVPVLVLPGVAAGYVGVVGIMAGAASMAYIPDMMFIMGCALLIIGVAILMLVLGVWLITRLVMAWRFGVPKLYSRLARKEITQ